MSYILVVISFIVLYQKISRLEERFNAILGDKKVNSPIIPVELSQSKVTVPFPTPADIPSVLAVEKSNRQTEFALGGKVFTGVGILAIFLAVGFFLRYAFENNLISEAARAVIGVIFGLLIISTGHFLRRKYSAYGNTLVGGGVGILYLTIYAAYGFYELISFPITFLVLFCVTVFSSSLSVLYNSKPLVTWSFIGAFLIPFILPIDTSVHILFPYLLIVNCGILLIACFKIWPEITVGSLTVSSLIYLNWVFDSYTNLVYVSTLAYLTILFVIYFLTSLFNSVLRSRSVDTIDAVLVYIVPIIYFLLSLAIVTGKHNIALLAFLIGLFYIVVSLIVRTISLKLGGELRRFSNTLFLIASPFIATSVALYFEGETITIIWAAQAVIMVLVGLLLNSSSNRVGGLILSLIVGFKFFIFEANGSAVAKLLFNERSVTIVCLVAMFLVLWKIYFTYTAKLINITEDEKQAGKFIGALGVFLALFLWIVLEANDFIRDVNFYLPIIWYLYSTLMISLAFLVRDKTIRYLSYIVMALALFLTFVYQWNLPTALYQPFFNIRTLTALIVVCVHSFILLLWKFNQKEVSSEEIKIVKTPLLLTLNGIVLWSVSLEIIQYYNRILRDASEVTYLSVENTKRVVLSVFWLLYGLVGLAVGIIKRSHFARYFSIVIFGITIFKIFLYDTANLSDIYRFISFITLGLILLISGFAYHKYKTRISELI